MCSIPAVVRRPKELEPTSAPTLSLPPTAAMADSMKTYGTNNATSTSGLFSVIDEAMPLASVRASSFVCGFSFQLPEMRGFRAWSLVVVDEEGGLVAENCPAGTKAAAEQARREASTSFMVIAWKSGCNSSNSTLSEREILLCLHHTKDAQ